VHEATRYRGQANSYEVDGNEMLLRYIEQEIDGEWQLVSDVSGAVYYPQKGAALFFFREGDAARFPFAHETEVSDETETETETEADADDDAGGASNRGLELADGSDAEPGFEAPPTRVEEVTVAVGATCDEVEVVDPALDDTREVTQDKEEA